MEDVATAPAPGEDASRRRSTLLRIAAPAMLAIVLVAVAVWMTGPSPRPADEGFPTAPPPLALPGDVPDDSLLARAAAALAGGDLDAANAGFTDVVAADRDGEVGQVGLVLSRWRSTGPVSVERDLAQLRREYPDSAFVALHLGMVQTLLDEPRAARATLDEARELGQAAGDETSLRMARLADDLLHPDAFRGDLPVLVTIDEVSGADRAALRELLDAVQSGDRREAAVIAGRVGPGDDPMLRVAAAVASFDKDDPDATVDQLDAIAAAGSTPTAVRDRARMLSALAGAWGGGSRSEACVGLRRAASPDADRATRRLAVPISRELCA